MTEEQKQVIIDFLEDFILSPTEEESVSQQDVFDAFIKILDTLNQTKAELTAGKVSPLAIPIGNTLYIDSIGNIQVVGIDVENPSIPESTVSVVAGMNLSGGRVVVVQGGSAVYFNPNDTAMYGLVTGITKSSAIQGGNVVVQTAGVFYESGLGLNPGSLYYAGVNGTLVLSPSGMVVAQVIGNSIDTDRISLNINSQPIITL